MGRAGNTGHIFSYGNNWLELRGAFNSPHKVISFLSILCHIITLPVRHLSLWLLIQIKHSVILWVVDFGHVSYYQSFTERNHQQGFMATPLKMYSSVFISLKTSICAVIYPPAWASGNCYFQANVSSNFQIQYSSNLLQQ